MFSTIKLGKAACLCASLAAAVLCAAVFGAVGRAYAAASESAEADPGSRQVPIIMYHSVVNDPSLAGDYVITPAALEEDLRWLRDNGYTAVLCRELPDFTEGKGDLPEKPVILSFDDGCYNNYYYALPLIEKYGFKAVFAPVGEWTEQAASEESPSRVYSYMDAENLRSCVLSGRIELADHTYSLHDLSKRRGVLRKTGETDGDYRRMLWNDLDRSRRLLESITGEPPVTLAYPYGFCSDDTELLAAELGYKVTLGCEERINTVSRGDYACLSRMGRFNRSASRPAAGFLSALEGSATNLQAGGAAPQTPFQRLLVFGDCGAVRYYGLLNQESIKRTPNFDFHDHHKNQNQCFEIQASRLYEQNQSSPKMGFQRGSPFGAGCTNFVRAKGAEPLGRVQGGSPDRTAGAKQRQSVGTEAKKAMRRCPYRLLFWFLLSEGGL